MPAGPKLLQTDCENAVIIKNAAAASSDLDSADALCAEASLDVIAETAVDFSTLEDSQSASVPHRWQAGRQAASTRICLCGSLCTRGMSYLVPALSQLNGSTKHRRAAVEDGPDFSVSDLLLLGFGACLNIGSRT